MSVLSDRDLLEAISNGELRIDNRDHNAIQPASIDLHLGDEIREVVPRGALEYYDLRSPTIGEEADHAAIVIPPVDGMWRLFPGRFYLATTSEIVTLGLTLGAEVKGKSSRGRLGLQIECAGWVDPGFRGQLTLEVVVFGPTPIAVRPGDRICQLIVHRLSSKALNGYEAKGGRYQHQMGATPARQSGDDK